MVYESIADNETARQVAKIWNSDYGDIRKGRFLVYGGGPTVFIEDCLSTLKMYFDSEETSEYFEKIFKPLGLKLRHWSITFSKRNKLNIRVILDRM